MPKTVLTLSHTVVRPVTCESCGVHYLYDDKIEVKQTLGGGPDAEARARDKAEAELDNQIATGGKIVPCPRCKALTARMRHDHLMMPVWLLVVVVVCLAGGIGVMLLAATVGALFWYLGLLALFGAGLGVLGLLAWPFGLFKEKIGYLPE